MIDDMELDKVVEMVKEGGADEFEEVFKYLRIPRQTISIHDHPLRWGSYSYPCVIANLRDASHRITSAEPLSKQFEGCDLFGKFVHACSVVSRLMVGRKASMTSTNAINDFHVGQLKQTYMEG